MEQHQTNSRKIADRRIKTSIIAVRCSLAQICEASWYPTPPVIYARATWTQMIRAIDRGHSKLAAKVKCHTTGQIKDWTSLARCRTEMKTTFLSLTRYAANWQWQRIQMKAWLWKAASGAGSIKWANLTMIVSLAMTRWPLHTSHLILIVIIWRMAETQTWSNLKVTCRPRQQGRSVVTRASWRSQIRLTWSCGTQRTTRTTQTTIETVIWSKMQTWLPKDVNLTNN